MLLVYMLKVKLRLMDDKLCLVLLELIVKA